jgi:predicted PurR-regulated permease PerM
MRTTPLSARILQLFGLTIIGCIIYAGQSILVPMGFAFVIAISLLPVYRVFKRLGLPDAVCVLAAILCGMVVLGGIIFVLSIEISHLLENKEALKANVEKHIQEIGFWVKSKTGIQLPTHLDGLAKQFNSSGDGKGSFLASTAFTVGGYIVWFGVVPIYVYLILYYKNLLVRFIFLAIKSDHHEIVEESIRDTESTVKSYLLGLFIEMLVLAVLVTISLTVFGIQYAILIAATFAVLNVIPYLGALIANLLAVLITMSTSPDLWDTILVLIILAVVQFIDNNLIMPNLVGSRLRINALVTIFAVIVGHALAGTGGMFLSVPVVAVLKVVFDKMDSMKHWAVLFGDDNPKLNPLQYPVMRLRKKYFRI